MADKVYTCGYKYCLHPGEKVSAAEAVPLDRAGKKKAHWDCKQIKMEIDGLKDLYCSKNEIEGKDIQILLKVLNDLVHKYGQDIEYVRFAIRYYASQNIKINSPFSLLYLRDNKGMQRKWERRKGEVFDDGDREGADRESEGEAWGEECFPDG